MLKEFCDMLKEFCDMLKEFKRYKIYYGMLLDINTF